MPWRPLPRIAFAVATYPFSATSPADLPLDIGDELYIIEQGGKDGSWFRGYLVAPPSLLAGLTCVKGQTLEARVFSGIFPRCCVEVREVLGDAAVDGHAHIPQVNGDSQSLDQTNGVSPRRMSSVTHRGSMRRPASNSSIGTRSLKTNGDGTNVNGTAKRLGRSPSDKPTNLTVGQSLARKLSHRSITSSQPRSSPVPYTPTSEDSRDPNLGRPQAPVPMLKIGDETPTSISEPLVDEIASCLREWHSKNLHELLLGRHYSVLEKVSNLVHRLDLARRQLLHGVLTAQELSTLREEIVWHLVDGNKLLSNEVIVRSPKQRGRLLTSDDSAIEMTKLQSTMSLLERPPLFHHDPVDLHHLMVDVKGFADNDLISPTLTMYLCSRIPGEPPKALTEAFTIDLPTQDEFGRSVFAGRYRTLFADLTTNDVGGSTGAGGNLSLVIKIQSSQELQRPPSVPRSNTPRDENTSPVRPATGTVASTSSMKGRQSLMWAQKRFGSVKNGMQQDPKPSKPPPLTANSANITDNEARPTTQEGIRPTTQQGKLYVKKNIGAGVLNLNAIFGQSSIGDHQVSIWTPAASSVGGPKSEDTWDDLVRDLISSPNGTYSRAKRLDHVLVGLQSFNSPDANDLIMKTPTLLQNVLPTHKIGFPGAPTKSRSDIYVRINEAFLPHQALLSHPERGTVQISPDLHLQNVQLTLEVRKMSGERIERCIFPSSNSTGQTAWRTSAVARGEHWDEMIKLVIPPDDVPEAHLIMSIADAPGFPFALAWMPLWKDKAFVKDGNHIPLLYLYDKVTSSSDRGRGAYLAFPWSSKLRDGDVKDDVLTGPIATLKLETELCSTSSSQDTILLGILKWKEQPRGEILQLLKRFAFVPEIELVKLIDEVFDALFNIMVDHAGNEDYEDSVFDALVTILGIAHDRRFNIGPYVDSYAESKFDHPFAAPCLIRSYLRLLGDPIDPSNSRRVRSTFKVGRQLLKFIIQARLRQEAKEAGIGANTQSTFKHDLRQIFHAFEGLMRNMSPTLVGSKTLVVQHMCSWLPELKAIFSEQEVLDVATDFLKSCAQVQGKLILFKLVFVLNLTNTEVFTQHNVRQQISENTWKWIEPYWGFQNEKAQWREQVRLCCSIVSKQVAELGVNDPALLAKAIQSYRSLQSSTQPRKDSLSILFPTSYPFPSKSLSNPVAFDEALAELSALIAALPDALAKGKNDFSMTERVDMLFDTLDFITSVLSGSAFPKSWLSLYIFYHRTSLRMLESLFSVMLNNFVPSPEDADDFNTELWSKYLSTLLALVRSDTLALETFPEQKRRAVWKIAGDVRDQGANLLRQSWEAIGWDSSLQEQKRYGLHRLGGFQVQYVPSLVAPVMELCLSVHEGLRNAAVRVLQAMIISEWTLNEDLSVIQAEMIDCFERLFQSKNIGESLVQKMFVNELLDLFGFLAAMPLDPMWQAIKGMITTIDELLELLAAVHSSDVTEALRIMNTLQLMSFLKDMQKEDIFIRYVHQLAHVQARMNNKAEAGLALQLHADLYAWDITPVRALMDPAYPEQTSFERKEQLYFEMIGYFEEGEAWDNALSSYRELADHYEHSLYDLSKLARTQRSMATLFENIARGDWQTPRYFKVFYHGMGFPTSLRDKQFVYEGEPGERQAAFTDRMRQLHPSAQIVPKGDVEDMEGQFLQISPVSPYRDLEHPIYQQPKVAQSTKDFLIGSRPYIFAVTSKRHSPSSGVHNQWVEKTLFTTRESFPTILRRSEITAVDVVRLSPLQTAVERTTRKTSELASLEKKIDHTDETTVQSLTEAIQSSVEPSSAASVAQYRQLIPALPSSPNEDGSDPTPSLLERALQIALLDHVSALKHCLTHYQHPQLTHTQAFLSDNLQETFAPEMEILSPHPPPDHDELFSTPDPFSPSAGTPALTLTNGDTPPSTAEPLSRPRPLSRLSLGFLKTSASSTPKANGSTLSPSAPSDDGSSSGHFSQAINGSGSANNSLSVEATPTRIVHGTDDTSSERPSTAASSGGKSGRLKKRLSNLGIGRAGSGRVERPKGPDPTMGGVVEE